MKSLLNDKCIGSVEMIDYQQYLDHGAVSKKINAVVLMHLQGESSSVMSTSLRSISKYNIKVIAASKEEIQEYASEAQALEYERKIKIMGLDSPKDIIQYIKETYENLVNLALANFDIYDEDRSGTLETDELAKLLSSLDIFIDDDALESCLKEIDADGTGTITKDEFMLWFLKVEPKTTLTFTAYIDNMMEKLPEMKNLQPRDMRSLKVEATSIGFDPKTAPINASFQIGILKDVQEPVYSQKKAFGMLNEKKGHIHIRIKSESSTQEEAELRQTEIENLDFFKMIKYLKSRHDTDKLTDSVDYMFDKITVEEELEGKVFSLYVNIIIFTSALKKADDQNENKEGVFQFQQLFEKMQKFGKGSLPNVYQKLLFKFAIKKTLKQLLVSNGTLLQILMGGFSAAGELSIWKKVDKALLNLLIEEAFQTSSDMSQEDVRTVKTFRSYLNQAFFLLQSRSSIKLDVTHPRVIDFQNNLLSWVRPGIAEFLQQKIKDRLPFDPKVFKRLAKHATDDIADRAPQQTRQVLYEIICG